MRALLLFLSFIGCMTYLVMNPEPIYDEDNMYCDMVDLYKLTQGRSGWPAYQGTEICTKLLDNK